MNANVRRPNQEFQRFSKIAIRLLICVISLVSLVSCGGGSSTSSPISVSPGSTPAVSTEAIYVAANGQISTFSVNTSTGIVSASTSIQAPPNIFDMKADPAGHFLYISDFNAGKVHAYSINQTSGALSEISGSPFGFPGAGNGGPLTIDPRGKFLFFADSQGETVSFAINTDGTLTLTGSLVHNSNQPIQFAVDPSSSFLYAANHSDFLGEFSVYSISATGALTAVPGSPFAVTQPFSQPYGIVIDGTGKFLFSALSNSKKVAAMRIDSSTGALTSVAGSPFTVGFIPQSVVLDSSGKFLYVGNTGDATISSFNVDSTTGALTPMSGSPIPESNPFVLAIDSAGQFLFVAEASFNNLSVFRVNSTTGALTRLGSPLAAGSFPKAISIVRLP
jgi:6-phosphogluconolactonase